MIKSIGMILKIQERRVERQGCRTMWHQHPNLNESKAFNGRHFVCAFDSFIKYPINNVSTHTSLDFRFYILTL